MPHLHISTNIAKSKITEEFNLHLTDVLAQTTGKPKGYCSVHILPGLIHILPNLKFYFLSIINFICIVKK